MFIKNENSSKLKLTHGMKNAFYNKKVITINTQGLLQNEVIKLKK
jgi:hypothetical protein